ncbi:unnamed protein product [Adineta ricciae]|uniref:Uncharacterized protein n=1 Tax=Adineta ricciae TaxID=249248 RepID=A0A814NP57_ADIRI|nr:unnamed protein product [Adineta ricciae]CAF1146284.1 unnamed protein product [Adineta ricciae]
MIIRKLVILFVCFALVDSNPIGEKLRQYDLRQRRSLDIRNWTFVDSLYKRFYKGESHRNDETEFRPVEGPINIEQLPAMLAARHVKRYPFSHEADPDIIGR